MAGTWQFRAMAPGEVNIDPFEGEFFTTEALPDLTHALVREAVQNSLDAGLPDETVRVRFTLLDAGQPGDLFTEPADARGLRAMLRGLRPHLEAPASGLEARPGRGDPDDTRLRWLVVEDFGTRGLEGDTHQFEDIETTLSTARNDFYYFWRNVGRSGKTLGERGRWGIGKTVFPASSRINAFFGLTVRRHDGLALLMGQSVLKIHKLAGTRYAPYGYFGRHSDGLSLPIEESDAIDRFRRSAGVSRRAEPGLSIVIPHADEEITCEGLVASLIEQYFVPFVAGTLVAEVGDGTTLTRLDAAGLDGAVRRSHDKRRHAQLGLIKLARRLIDLPADRRATLRSPPAGHAPKFDDSLFEAADLERLRRGYEAGQAVLIEGSVPVLRRPPAGENTRTPPGEGRFTLLLERDEEIRRGEGHYVRQGITIANLNVARPRSVRWILQVADDLLGALLGDAENPAHTEWQRSSPALKKCYKLGPTTVGYVKAIPKNICATLSRPARGRDPGLLRRLFSISRDAALAGPEGRQPSEKPTVEAATADPTDQPIIDGKSRIQISKIESGFRVAGESCGAGDPVTLDIQLAYEVRRGNPFRRYVPLDFEVDRAPVTITAEGATVVQGWRNRIRVDVNAPRFEIEARGFDPHRDLRVKVLTVAEGRR